MTLYEFLENFYGGTRVRILHHHDNTMDTVYEGTAGMAMAAEGIKDRKVVPECAGVNVDETMTIVVE